MSFFPCRSKLVIFKTNLYFLIAFDEVCTAIAGVSRIAFSLEALENPLLSLDAEAAGEPDIVFSAANGLVSVPNPSGS